jgi:hypothetical protein
MWLSFNLASHFIAMTLSYILHEAGWATATIEHDGRHREMRVSYLSDAVLNMLDAAIGLVNNGREVRFNFMDEPGEHECVVTRTGPDAVRIRVVWYKDWIGLSDEPGEEVFACDGGATQFCERVFACCKRLLDEHGEDGYKERWIEHEFPTETFEQLSRLLYPPRRTQAA